MIELYDEYINNLQKKYNTLADVDNELFVKLITEVYNDGCNDGQTFVWKMRANDFDDVEITEAGKSIGLTKEDFLKTTQDSSSFVTVTTTTTQ